MSSNKNLIIVLSAGLLLTCFFLLADLDGIFKMLLLILFFIFTVTALKPKLGLLLLIIVRPCLDILTAEPIIETENFSLNFASLFAILIILFSAIILIKNLSNIENLPLKYNWLIFIAIALASIFFSYNSFSSLAEGLRLLSILAIYCLAYFLLNSEQDLKNLIKAIIASAIIPSLFALWQFYTQTGLTVPLEGIYNRIYGTFAHPNLFAYYLLLPLALSLYLFLSGNKKQINNILYFLFAIFLVIILGLTFTRGAWLSFLIIMAIVGVFRYRPLLVGAIVFAALAYFLVEPINYRVNDLIANRSDTSIEWRLNLWNDAKEYVKEKPWLGYGAGVASDLILDKRGEQFGSSDPHNDYLKIASENGLIGLLAYLSLIVSLFINLIKKYSAVGRTQFKTLILLAIGLAISFYVMSAADNIIRNTALQWSFWALMGAIFAIDISVIASDRRERSNLTDSAHR
ncbi:MAG: O-antigen ligase family protein [Candidatus Saccharimonadaceae bacterium]|nr:O-antigen ligase family protein [Candidatus Saccharimonadaceae bacterium]